MARADGQQNSMDAREHEHVTAGGAANEPLEITIEAFENAGRWLMTQAELAAHLGVSRHTINRRMQKQEYRNAYERGKSLLTKSLRAKQIQMALNGDKTMLVWLGKVVLQQSEQVDHKHEVDVKASVQVVHQIQDPKALREIMDTLEEAGAMETIDAETVEVKEIPESASEATH
jgi:DNA-binding Lrp family transcriptional regulator